MNGMLEIVFEGVQLNHLAGLVMDYICEEGNISEATQDGIYVPSKYIIDPAYWEGIGSATEDTACTVNLRTIKIGGKSVDMATLRIIHYSNVNDVSVLLSSIDCKRVGLSDSDGIYHWARDISGKFGVENFYGGVEPASDEDMRLFSKNGIGLIQKL